MGQAATTYGQTAGGQRAAAISYRVLFSLVPFVALLVSVLELVLPEGTQESVVSWLVGVASLPDELADSVDAAVEDVRAVGVRSRAPSHSPCSSGARAG